MTNKQFINNLYYIFDIMGYNQKEINIILKKVFEAKAS